jgi:hypothetical protein
MKTRLCLILLLSLVAGGCAVGNRYAYDTTVADTGVRGSAAVAVAVHDERPYVVSGNKTPQFVGMQRGGFGNAFDVTTGSNQALSADMTASLAASLRQSGFKVEAVAVAYTDSAEQVRKALMATGAERSVLLTVYEWKSDAMMRMGLDYDLRLSVLGEDGAVLAESQLHGTKEVLGAAPMIPSGGGPMVANAFKAKLEQLFADPAVARALRAE